MNPPSTASAISPGRATFDTALTGTTTHLQLSNGRRLPLSAQRWHQPASGEDRWLLEKCHGSTLDLGCGPGRLVEALLARGVPALGVDSSALAVRHCHSRGAPVLHGSLFDHIPSQGHWCHVVLADGNIGIGGDPVRLLRRAATLLRAGGSVLVEAAGARCGLWRGRARLHDRDGLDEAWFPWAELGLDAVPDLAGATGLRLLETYSGSGRHFARLGKPLPGHSTEQRSDG